MCVYMYVCMYVCRYVCLYVWMYTMQYNATEVDNALLLKFRSAYNHTTEHRRRWVTVVEGLAQGP